MLSTFTQNKRILQLKNNIRGNYTSMSKINNNSRMIRHLTIRQSRSTTLKYLSNPMSVIEQYDKSRCSSLEHKRSMTLSWKFNKRQFIVM